METYDSRLALSGSFSSELNISSGKWYYIAAVYDGELNTIKFYLNGKNAGECIAALPEVQGTIYIGEGPTGGHEYLSGKIDDIRIYNRALSESEIQKLQSPEKGDVNDDNQVNLADAILCLKLSGGMSSANLHLSADVDGDNKIGVAEVVYIMQKMTGMR